ncbi:pyridoxamine 5'-phosphate oxidase family protein [Ramlibacter humi]|uniref:Flavin-nucleotide-binding protein n=1 Tax=Ramlibacter humi TaxID=2530451 RepID=A0A4Z0C066_9BURK|nr:pyridoxamine 5'-phosphate oxidase family protein [Ramlibacter humi]TFZ03619.1 flavin-nucleotide-binding protein [Ramlibacter humi]
MTTEAFHAGERELQVRAGVRERLAAAGERVVRNHMPQQHRDFFAQLPWLLVGALDAQGQPWATALAGPPGFVDSPDERLLRVRAQPAAGDPLAGALVDGRPVGLLGLEAHTRRRNRLNGWVFAGDATGFHVQAGQSFGNCPKYIQARRAEYDPGWGLPGEAGALAALDEEARSLIAAADTFFIATAHPDALADGDPAHGVDLSHRGGRPGFVHVAGDELLVPDFAGNLFFNTFGNLLLQPRCGLLFIDYASGDLLWLAAHAAIDWNPPAGFSGAQRMLRLRVTAARRGRRRLPLRWSTAQPAPELALTGHW